MVETNHLPHLISLIVNDDFFQNLTPEEQEIMTQAAKTATEYAREQSDARISNRIATIEASGTAILTLSDETRDAIREAGFGHCAYNDPAGGFCIDRILFCYGQYKSKGDQL